MKGSWLRGIESFAKWWANDYWSEENCHHSPVLQMAGLISKNKKKNLFNTWGYTVWFFSETLNQSIHKAGNVAHKPLSPTWSNLTDTIKMLPLLKMFFLGEKNVGSKYTKTECCVLSKFSICSNTWQAPNKSQGDHKDETSLESKAPFHVKHL